MKRGPFGPLFNSAPGIKPSLYYSKNSFPDTMDNKTIIKDKLSFFILEKFWL